MYAVIQTGGKQYRVKEGDLFFVEKLPAEKNEKIVFDSILMVSDDNSAQIGTPILEGARVACEVVEQFRAKKILVYKFKRRKKYRNRQGHRQYHTRLRVLEIAPDGNLKG
ncbi:MAG: 50S ribosomal protein L21 [Myxococcales bacterium]|nr:50S ribosomal protein L21 [Myxococcales bacterium]MCB9644236.1 50S ribosomal protein L21 [Myxococcales bacterium]